MPVSNRIPLVALVFVLCASTVAYAQNAQPEA